MPELPGDVDGDGDAFDDGPGAYTLCVSAGLTAVGAGIGTYAARMAYYDALSEYNTARYKLGPGGPATYDPKLEAKAYAELYDKEQKLNTAFWVLAGSAVTTGAVLLGVVAACAPLIPLPIP